MRLRKLMPPIDLAHVSELDLLCELSRRAIKREHGALNPVISLIRLSGAMANMLDAHRRHHIINELRDLADALEVRELVS